MAQQDQLGLDTWCTPGRVLAAHPTDQLANLGIKRRTPDPAASGLPAPVELETLTMPADDRRRLDDDQARLPTPPHPGQPRPEHPVTPSEPRALDRPPQHGQLVTQSQILGHQDGPTSQQASQQRDDQLEDGHGVSSSGSTAILTPESLRPRIDVSRVLSRRTEFSVGTADVKTVMELARHSTPVLTMQWYASADEGRLREATEAVAQHVEDVIGAASCCAGVARLAVGAEGHAIKKGPEGPSITSNMVGATGFEPATSASRTQRSKPN